MPPLTIAFPSPDLGPRGCISSTECPFCHVKLVCESSGKAGTRTEDTRYIWGPCCCGLHVCPECGHDWLPELTNLKWEPELDLPAGDLLGAGWVEAVREAMLQGLGVPASLVGVVSQNHPCD